MVEALEGFLCISPHHPAPAPAVGVGVVGGSQNGAETHPEAHGGGMRGFKSTRRVGQACAKAAAALSLGDPLPQFRLGTPHAHLPIAPPAPAVGAGWLGEARTDPKHPYPHSHKWYGGVGGRANGCTPRARA